MCVCVYACACSVKEEFQGSATSESKSVLEVVEHSLDTIENWHTDIGNKLDVLPEEEEKVCGREQVWLHIVSIPLALNFVLFACA